jgi:hypothetical protein
MLLAASQDSQHTNLSCHILEQDRTVGWIHGCFIYVQFFHESKYLNVMEKLYIYKTTKYKEILNEQHVGDSSVQCPQVKYSNVEMFL